MLAGVAAAEYLEPVRQNLGFGQVNALLMAAIAVDVLVRHPRWPRGALIGIAISIKLTPAAFLLLFLLRRDWRALATSVAAAAASVGVAWLIMPADSAQYWFHTLKETSRIGPPYFAGNQSLKGFAFRLGLGDGASTAVWLALSVVAVVLAAVWMRRLLADGAVPAALLVNAAAVLLVSPVSWSHHWVWAARPCSSPSSPCPTVRRAARSGGPSPSGPRCSSWDRTGCCRAATTASSPGRGGSRSSGAGTCCSPLPYWSRESWVCAVTEGRAS